MARHNLVARLSTDLMITAGVSSAFSGGHTSLTVAILNLSSENSTGIYGNFRE